MNNIWDNSALALAIWLGNYAIYLLCNHGIAPNARLQQFLRYLPASAVAVLPLGITGTCFFQPAILVLLVASELLAVAYPLTYHLTFRKSSPDYDHQIDIAFAIYFFGIATGLGILTPPLVSSVIVALALPIPIFIFGYYFIYHHVIDTRGMMIIQQTNYNEIIEFFRSYPRWRTLTAGLVLASVIVVPAGVCMTYPIEAGYTPTWAKAVIAVIVLAVSCYMWKPSHGLFIRTGLVKLYLEVREYFRNNMLYRDYQHKRMERLQVRCDTPLPSPHSILLVIGESASRDFMSAFSKLDEDTTPWLRELSEDHAHCVIFPHAYSCDIQTVPTLEKALTACNQYDGGQFYTSCSIVDIAHKAGYKVHWYSNQGHLGAADTPISLVAETSDVAKWTNQQLGEMQYDENLLDFFSEVNPTCNNLIVLHLKGSHFNYENRFPEKYRQWGAKGDHDQITNYKNTLYFTDKVLQNAFDRMREYFNLQAMVYCSDHADVPDRHRQPNFGGFRDMHIPLAVWMGDDYIRCRTSRAEALRKNQGQYWTNDLLYDLVCGILDVKSDVFKEDNSLASTLYRHTRDGLSSMNGTIRIINDIKS